jgi:hypothetical protein
LSIVARTPVDVYRGLTQTRLGDDINKSITLFVSKFSDYVLADEQLTTHLSRFIGLMAKLSAYLSSRYIAGGDDLTIAIDLLDQFTSTTKWWVLDRRSPGIVLRPRVRDPRDFIGSVRTVSLSGPILTRINGSTDKLERFLDEQDIKNSAQRKALLESLGSSWTLLSAFISRYEGRTLAAEEDFERAYDVMRILLFYIPLTDLKALVASRTIATSPVVVKAARISLTSGFERRIETSVAAHLEKQHEDDLTQIATSKPSASRNILTNSLRILAQLHGVEKNIQRIEEDNYEAFALASIDQLERLGLSADSLDNEASVIRLFKNLKPDECLNEHIELLTRRLEGLIIDKSGNRDFLVQNARFIPRLLALLLLVAAGTKSSEGLLSDSDITRGLNLLAGLFNE